MQSCGYCLPALEEFISVSTSSEKNRVFLSLTPKRHCLCFLFLLPLIFFLRYKISRYRSYFLSIPPECSRAVLSFSLPFVFFLSGWSQPMSEFRQSCFGCSVHLSFSLSLMPCLIIHIMRLVFFFFFLNLTYFTVQNSGSITY